MAAFPIQPISRFQGVNTSIKRPTEIAYYSVDEERHVSPFSNEQLRYYYPPFFSEPTREHASRTERPSLSNGFDIFRKRDESVDEHLEGLLDTIVEQEKKTGEILATDFVGFRGQMTKIMTAPFDRYADFEMNATCYQGTIYIEENHEYRDSRQTNQQPKNQRRNNDQELFQYWGYKFENLSTTKKPWHGCTRGEIESRDSDVVDNIAEYCSIVRTGIGNNTLIIGGEVDCVLGEKPDDPTNLQIPWVELKTSKQIESDRDALNFEQKMCRFWAQSFLLGVPTIVVGWRSRDGMLLGLEEIPTQRIPGKVKREGKGSWDGNICINFASAFLDFLKETVVGEGVWRLEFKQGMKGIAVRRITESGTGRIVKDDFKAHRERLARQLRERDAHLAQDIVALLGTK